MFSVRLKNAARAFALVALLFALLVFVGCGGSDDSSAKGGDSSAPKATKDSPGQGNAPPPQFSPTAAYIQVATIPGLGEVLIDSAHKTYYFYDKDKRGSKKTNCYGRCEEIWFPKPSGHVPQPGPGADESMLGFFRRKDNIPQATYNGWPLYTYIREGNEKSKGVGLSFGGGTFYPLHPDGTKAGG